MFAGLATILTGAVVIHIYLRQKREEKVQAARIIIQEIREAEDKVDIVTEKMHSGATNNLPPVLPVNNWRKYSHLFAKDFDQDELKLINGFYSNCEIIHDMVGKQNNFFWITTEERARVVQNKLADLLFSEAQNVDTLLDKYSRHPYSYAPQRTLDEITFAIGQFKKISIASCGQKFKHLSDL